MKNAFTPLYKQLLANANQFSPEAIALKNQNIKQIHRQPLPQNKVLVNYQHLLLFLAAHAHDAAFLKAIDGEMERVSNFMKKLKPALRDKLSNTGLPHTTTLSSYSHDLLRWMNSNFLFELQWDSSSEDEIEMGQLLQFTLPDIEKDWTSAGYNHQELLETLQVKEKDQLGFYLSEMARLDHVPFIKDFLQTKLQLYVNVVPQSKLISKLFNRFNDGSHYYHNDIIKHFDHEQLLNTPVPEPLQLDSDQQNDLIRVMRVALVLLERETDPCTYIDVTSLRYYQLERGISIAIFGMTPDRQMSMESYVGYTLFKNGYPAAYGGGWVYGARSLFGINVFEQFRGGESGYILCQLLRTYRQVFGVNYFEVEPYQYGLDNPEGIASGAFWFYYRYGFRPLDKKLNQLASQEDAKIKAKKGYRSSEKTLVRFTESNIGLNLQKDVPPSVTQVRQKVTAMIAKRFKSNRQLAIQTCVQALKNKINVPQFLSKNEEVVLHDIALVAEALDVQDGTKLHALIQMVKTKPVNLYKHNHLIKQFLGQ